MKYYAGLDVSLKETFICIVNEQGKTVHEGHTSSDPKAIAEYLTKTKLAIEKAAVESGSLSHWLVSGLQERKMPVICVDSRHMSAILSMNVNKTDSNDARGIANALRADLIREVVLKSQELVEAGIILESRSTLVGERTRLKNAVRGFLKSFGIKVTTTGKASFVREVQEEIKDKSEPVKAAIEALLAAFQAIDKEIQSLEIKIKDIAKNSENVKLLMTIPGVGVLTALSFLVAIGDYTRFKDSRNVAAYLGLTPRQYSSGEMQRQGRISKCGSRTARSLLVEASTVMLTRTKTWCRPKAWAMKLQKKKGFKKATVALARKLAVIMHSMLVKREKFRFGEEEKKQKAKTAA